MIAGLLFENSSSIPWLFRGLGFRLLRRKNVTIRKQGNLESQKIKISESLWNVRIRRDEHQRRFDNLSQCVHWWYLYWFESIFIIIMFLFINVVEMFARNSIVMSNDLSRQFQNIKSCFWKYWDSFVWRPNV